MRFGTVLAVAILALGLAAPGPASAAPEPLQVGGLPVT
jgi:hypothetical protein